MSTPAEDQDNGDRITEVWADEDQQSSPELQESDVIDEDDSGELPSLYVIAFHERQLHGVSEQYWSTAHIPFQLPGMKDGRMCLNADLSGGIKEDRIPSTGRVYLIGAGGDVKHAFNYSIPSARSRVMDAASESSNTDSTSKVGFVRTGELHLSEFPDYAALPDEKWFQLNSMEDPFTLQIKMKKVRPSDIYRSITRGEYFVYTPVKIVLRPAFVQPSAPATTIPAELGSAATFVGTAPGPAPRAASASLVDAAPARTPPSGADYDRILDL